MSKTVTINKPVEIRVECVQCNNCGQEMDFSIKIDFYNDLQIIAKPCKCVVDDYIESAKQ